jgi:hypothetical protein
LETISFQGIFNGNLKIKIIDTGLSFWNPIKKIMRLEKDEIDFSFTSPEFDKFFEVDSETNKIGTKIKQELNEIDAYKFDLYSIGLIMVVI